MPTADAPARPRYRLWPVPLGVFLIIWGLTTHGKFSLTGDEPHYLLMAESLRVDGDLDLANDYAPAPGDQRREPPRERHARLDQFGALRSMHEPGLAVLLLPVHVAATWLAETVPPARLAAFRMTPVLFAYALVSLFMLALTCLGLWLLMATLARRGPPGHARAATLIVALSPPILANAFLVFPDTVACTVSCLALWTAYGPGRAVRWAPLVTAAALGLLPWTHRKFTLFAAGLLFVVAWERRDELRVLPRSRAMGLAGVFLAPVIAFHVWSWLHWGNLAGPQALDGLPLSWRTALSGLPGLLIDRENGLLVWAPIYVAALAAWWHTRATTWPLLVPVLLLYLPSAANEEWWGGFAPAARFLVPLVPLLALPLASGLADRVFARAVLALCVPQLIISAIGWQRPRFLWPRGDGHNRVLETLPGIGRALNDALPSFRVGPVDAVAVSLVVLVLIAAVLALTWATSPANRAETSSRHTRPSI